MAVDLADLVPSIKLEVNPPGTNLFPEATDTEWIDRLANGRLAELAEPLRERLCPPTTDFDGWLAAIVLADHDRVVESYLSGSTIKEIAQSIGVKPLAINKRMNGLGFTFRRRGPGSRPLTPAEERELVERYQAGETTQAMCKRFGIAWDTARSHLQKAGVEIRRTSKGKWNGMWKGGTTSHGGYTFECIPDDHPMASMRNSMGYVAQHRLVMAEAVGRPLLPHPQESVHHIDGDRSHNVLENLQLRIGQHGAGQVVRCRECGSVNVEHMSLAEVPR